MEKSMFRKHFKFILLGAFIVLAVAGVLTLNYLRSSPSVFAVQFRRYARTIITSPHFPRRPDARAGLDIVSERLYINNILSDGTRTRMFADNKRIIQTANFNRLVDYAHGYMVDLPPSSTFDFTKSPKFTTVTGDGFTAVISREWSVEQDVTGYVAYFFNRFTLDQRFQENNRVRLLENYVSEERERLRIVVDDWASHLYDSYTTLIFKTGTQIFFRVMLNYDRNNPHIPEIIEQIENSFRFFAPSGQAVYDLNWYPILPDNWTPETQALYNKFLDPDTFLWGIFVRRVVTYGIDYEIPNMEAKIGRPFDIILAYAHLPDPFPVEFMQRTYEEGRIVQLTMQMTDTNNVQLYTTSPLLELIRERDEPRIRQFARDAADWGKPFLFRLNNEMNSDWTSFGAVNNLSDPRLFIEAWQIVYRIFEEEGVNNAIWIWNPNDRDAPPNAWNSFTAYYPGNQYVHMLGITGYNTGTHYLYEHNEQWREFQNIYDLIVQTYDGIFDDFPWIITEFASSSIGGDKVRWIEGMFDALPRYPKIRAAVWFSYPDWDFRYAYGEIAARPYWLDETPETLEAFRQGLKRMFGEDF